VNDKSRIILGGVLGAACGAAAAYLFLTSWGRGLRERFEPAVDDLRREFMRFEKTIAKMGDLANDGMRMMSEFKAARHSPSSGMTPH
jgi:gas vesicle protein